MNEIEFPPQGFVLPDGTRKGRVLAEDSELGLWQIVQTSAGSSALMVHSSLYDHWIRDNIIGEGLFVSVQVNDSCLLVLSCKRGYMISSIQYGPYPSTIIEARGFAMTLRNMRNALKDRCLHDAIYIEQYSLLLPAYTQEDSLSDDYVLGKWLSGGVNISVESFGELCRLITWLNTKELQTVVNDAGFTRKDMNTEQRFSLPGRPMLEEFFNEHVIEIVRNEEKYRRVGIEFPSAIVLYGPPGCGKTFAVDKLIKFLGWPSYSVNSGTIGSPYIHDTSRKIAGMFDEAIANAPSVLVIDEMDAFLSDRSEHNSGTYHVEEVSEFLRRIPEASRQRVLIIAMTNRIDAIDPAVIRRGRFDHVIEVSMPSVDEVKELLSSLVKGLPLSEEVNLDALAKKLEGRPLSDAAFVVKEAGRLSVRSGKDAVDDECIKAAYESLSPSKNETRRLGF